MTIKERVKEALGAAAVEVNVQINRHFNERDLYVLARQRRARLWCYGQCARKEREHRRHLDQFHMVEVVEPSADVHDGVELAIDIIAAIGEESRGQLFAESRAYNFRDLVVMGEAMTTPERSVTQGGREVEDAKTREEILAMDSMRLALRHDGEAAHTPGCLLLVQAMPASDTTETAGERTEIYCQVPGEPPLELANVYRHRGEDAPYPTVDIGVGVERCLMRARGVWEIAGVVENPPPAN